MRLATGRFDGSTRLLLLDAADGCHEVGVLAAGNPLLSGLGDVGELYRRGTEAVEALQSIAAAGSFGAPIDAPAFAPPVTNPSSILCVGRNYRAHVAESNSPLPTSPLLFSKYPLALAADGEPVIKHAITEKLDYEGELAVIIGRRASRVAEADAMSYVAGYTVLDDITARDLQDSDVQWIRAKSLDTFCPMGPVFVSADDVPDVNALRIRTHVNGELRQDASVSEMIFSIPSLIAFITEAMTLRPGDIIATGTPSGVGMGMDPQVWLQPGDEVVVEIEGIGRLRSPISAPARA